MDENKEILTGEAQDETTSSAGAEDNTEPETAFSADAEENTEAAADSDVELTDEIEQSDIDKDSSPEADDDSGEEEPPVTEAEEPAEIATAPKKKQTLQFTIIISAFIVLAVLIAALVFRLFFNNSVVNTNIFGAKSSTTWHYLVELPEGSTVDEAQIPKIYFIFEPDGKLKIEQDSIEYTGSYTIQNLEEKDLIGAGNSDAKVGQPMLNIEDTGLIDGNFLFAREGNAFTENQLTLTSLESSQTVLKFDSKDYTPPTYEREGEFTRDDALIGSWTYRNEKATQTFTFNGDGTFEIKTVQSNTIQKQTGIYNCADGVVTIIYKNPTQQEQPVKYTIADDKLSMTVVVNYGGMQYEQPLGEYTKE